MKKLHKPLGNIFYLSTCIVAVPLLILIFNYDSTDYKYKFEATAINTEIVSFEKEWGAPDEVYKNNNSIIYFYDADILKWSQYVFVFEDDLLSKKAIDD